jgi:hypothetical protein
MNVGEMRSTTSPTSRAKRFDRGEVGTALSTSLKPTITLVIRMCTMSFKPVSWKSGGSGMANKKKLVLSLCYVVCVLIRVVL